MALLDVKKAFDTFWIAGLIYKLYKAGLDSTLLNIINNYEQFECAVCIGGGGKLSSWFTPQQGVHQGDVMSMRLYTFYTDDMLHELSSSRVGARISHIDCTCPTFADDVALTAISKNALNQLLDICLTYIKKWRFTFSWIKSLSIIFGRDTDPVTDIIIGREIIKTVTFACHLGIPLTSKPADLNQHVDGKMSTSRKCYYTIAGLAPPSMCLQDSTHPSAYQSCCMVLRCWLQVNHKQ